jgi:AraC family transcriptional regulator of adaptative response/methylated-DNA-[protein]-cysteine methyltransferase
MSRSINAVGEQRSMPRVSLGGGAVPDLLYGLPRGVEQGVWGLVPTCFGPMRLAGCEEWLGALDAAPAPGAEQPPGDLMSQLRWRRSDALARELLAHYVAVLRAGGALHVGVAATGFQREVWSALQRIPPGSVVGYGELATALGRPGAARAVGSALAANSVAMFVPCHRVVPATGGCGKFRWGAALKQRLLAAEAQQGCSAALLLL